MIVLADAFHKFSGYADTGGRYLLLALGLGFVVFFHELGHFLAAKYSRVRVDQFAVGFGPAILAWRKGIGLHRGTTTPEMEKRVGEYLERNRGSAEAGAGPPTAEEFTRAREALNLGETEYRLNWIPLGGYVKMLGQDDLNPDAVSNDPHSYTNKPIRLRMLIISAGVLMNIFLAAIGFMIVFLMGFHSAPAEVGGVMSDSPAANAVTADGVRHPLEVGDRILQFDGRDQQDFAKVALTVALVRQGEAVPIVVKHRDGQIQTLYVTPGYVLGDAQGLLSMGILPPAELRGPDVSDKTADELSDPGLFSADTLAIKPGDVITAINGEGVRPLSETDTESDYWKLNQAMREAGSEPIDLTVRGADGAMRDVKVSPHFQASFNAGDINLAGMVLRARVDGIQSKDSPAYGKLRPGDVIEQIKSVASGVAIDNPSPQQLKDAINAAGQNGTAIALRVVDASGGEREVPAIVPTARVAADRRGLGVQLGCDELNTVIAAVNAGSLAEKAGLKPGERLVQLGGENVSNWFEVRRLLAAATPGQNIQFQTQSAGGTSSGQLVMTQDQIDAARFIMFAVDLPLHERTELRKTTNPLQAAAWGVSETRDFVLQFYVTLRRMIGGSVSYKQAMGPVGIVRFGAMTAERGMDWLVWFLAMISANLAVANFLPIPVMDGGLFVLLILEGVQGKPLSANAQRIIQMIGLAIILSLFLLVTYQDIMRPFGHG